MPALDLEHKPTLPLRLFPGDDPVGRRARDLHIIFQTACQPLSNDSGGPQLHKFQGTVAQLPAEDLGIVLAQQRRRSTNLEFEPR